MTALEDPCLSIPEPSMPGCRAGLARTPNTFSGRASIRRDTEMGLQSLSVIVLPRFALPSTRALTGTVETDDRTGTHARHSTRPARPEDKR
jgi:hypothetical protein